MTILKHRSSVATILSGLVLTVIGSGFIIAVQLILFEVTLPNSAELGIKLLSIALLAFFLSPLRNFLNTFIERNFYKEELADQEALRNLSESLLKSSDLLSVITASVETLCTRLTVPYAVCYILQKGEHDHLQVKQVVPWHHPSPQLPSLDKKEAVMQYLWKHGKSVRVEALVHQVKEEEAYLRTNNLKADDAKRSEYVKDHVAKVALIETLKALKANVVIPLMAKEQLFGLIFLAAPASHKTFTEDDLAFIDIATSETITSIQRANYFEGDLQKTEFISIASHELRTPLTAIRGYLSMILDEHLTGTELGSESIEQLTTAYSHTSHLIAMVNDLLTLSRLESGKTRIEPQQIDLLEVAQKHIEKHHHEAESKKVTITLENKRSLPHAWADPDGIGIVFDNLISNAITYNKVGGGVTIKLSSHIAKGIVTIAVHDTGIGMSKEEMSRLFGKFYRVESDATSGISGTGLGLNITQTYIQRMKGSIHVQSRPGNGTTFTVALPLFTPDSLRTEAQSLTEEVKKSAETQEDTPIGLILLSAKRSGESYSAADLQLLEAVGHQAIITIQRAKLYEGDQMKTQFVSLASHELLTPIAAIEGYITLILEKEKATMAPKTAEFLQNVSSAIHRLSSLVRDLLSVSRLESGKITINKEPFDISKSVRETLVQLEFVAAERKIDLKLRPLPASLPMANGDAERTTQVLMNLVGNAIKYNREGGSVTIEVTGSKASNEIKIAVTDTGIGMDSEEMSHLFEKFYRINSQQTVGIVGTGLGLYITKTIVERMGGKISVKSTPGKGSTFAFSLPAAHPALR